MSAAHPQDAGAEAEDAVAVAAATWTCARRRSASLVQAYASTDCGHSRARAETPTRRGDKTVTDTDYIEYMRNQRVEQAMFRLGCLRKSRALRSTPFAHKSSCAVCVL